MRIAFSEFSIADGNHNVSPYRDHRYEEILSYEGKDVTNMCDVAERLENKGRLEGIQEGRNEGQNDLVKAIQFLRNGKSDEEILQTGIDEKTLALAKTIR